MLIPNYLKHDTIKDGAILKKWKHLGSFGLRIWVRDDYRLNHRRKAVCDTPKFRFIPKDTLAPNGYRNATLQEGKTYEMQIKNMLNDWSRVAFNTGEYRIVNGNNDYKFFDTISKETGEVCIIQDKETNQ